MDRRFGFGERLEMESSNVLCLCYRLQVRGYLYVCGRPFVCLNFMLHEKEWKGGHSLEKWRSFKCMCARAVLCMLTCSRCLFAC